MENATKALLIAAAILIAIVLISLGVFVMRQGQEAVNKANLTEAEILAYNGRFDSYSGVQRGSNVLALLDRLDAVNIELRRDGVEEITINIDRSNVSSSKYYNVDTSDKDEDTGLIQSISVTEQ